MIAQVEGPIGVFDNILKSLSEVVTGDSGTPMDINLVANQDNSLQIYIRVFNSIQVMHKLSDGGDVDIDVEQPQKLSFSSETLYSLISQVDSDRVTLRFDRKNFRVRVDDGWFTTPTEFKLRVFQESEFSPPILPENLKKVRTMKADPLRHRLSMMGSIAPEVNFKVQENEFWISVNDAVQGQGKVMKNLDEDATIGEVEFSYEIDPVETFLKNVRTDDVEVKMAESGGLMIKSETESQESYLLLAHRLDDQSK